MDKKLTRQQIERLVAAANTAPSADNCQPWAFSWDGEALTIGHDPERATHVLDHLLRMSCLTLGGLVEALTIAAARENAVARFELTPGIPGSIWAKVFTRSNILSRNLAVFDPDSIDPASGPAKGPARGSSPTE